MNAKFTKVALTIAISILTAISANAQQNSYNYIETNGGINFSKVYGVWANTQYRKGANFGLTVGHKFNSPLFVETGIRYTQKGSRIENLSVIVQNMDGSTSVSPIRFTDRFDYVSIPLGVGAEFGEKVKFRFQQSVNLDVLTNSSSEFNGMILDTPSDIIYRKIDLSLTTSVGIKVPFGNFYAGANVSANFGLRGLHDTKSEIPGLKTPKRTLMVLGSSLSIGYNF